MNLHDLTPQQKAAHITDAFNAGETFSTLEIAAMFGITRQGAYRLLDGISPVVPLILYGGKWGRLPRQRHVGMDVIE